MGYEQGFIAVTSDKWFDFIYSHDLKRVNFWCKKKAFKAILPGQPLFFLRKNSRGETGERKVVGFGILDYFELCSCQQAWDFYGLGNGFSSYSNFYEGVKEILDKDTDENLGCIILKDLTFFSKPVFLSNLNIPFQSVIVSGKKISSDEVHSILVAGGYNQSKQIECNKSEELTVDDLKNGKTEIQNHESYQRKTFLLTYNIDKWQWDNFEEAKNSLIDEGRYIDSWSCGNSKKLRTGDRVFLIKLGKDPRGIMASGLVFDSVYKAPHWNKERRLKGELINYVNVDFDVIRNPVSHEMLLMNQLKEIDPHFKWSSQSSGIEIPSNIAEKLEKLWSEMTGSNISTLSRNEVGTEEIFYPERYTEGALTQITVNKYERNVKARKACLEKYGYICRICNENLEDKYGELGKEFIHVHHIVPLNEIKKEYKINPITDLIPVCPNCHAIIHRKNPAYTPEKIIAILRK